MALGQTVADQRPDRRRNRRLPKPCSEPCLILPATSLTCLEVRQVECRARRRRAAPLGPSTKPRPPPSARPVATPGIASIAPITRSTRRRIVQQRSADIDVAVETEDAAEQLGAKTVHHRHDDDQHGHGQGDSDEGDDRDDGHAAVLALGAQIAAGDRPLPGRRKGLRVSGRRDRDLAHAPQGLQRRRPAAGSARSPVARRFSSTMPLASPLGRRSAARAGRSGP